MSAHDFAAAVAFGCVTPGPVLIAPTFVGYRAAGIPRALAATLRVPDALGLGCGGGPATAAFHAARLALQNCMILVHYPGSSGNPISLLTRSSKGINASCVAPENRINDDTETLPRNQQDPDGQAAARRWPTTLAGAAGSPRRAWRTGPFAYRFLARCVGPGGRLTFFVGAPRERADALRRAFSLAAADADLVPVEGDPTGLLPPDAEVIACALANRGEGR